MFTKLPKDLIQLVGLELNPKSLYELNTLNKRLHVVLDKYFWMNLCIRDFKLNTDEHYAYYYKPSDMLWKEFYKLSSVKNVNKLLWGSAKDGHLEFVRIALNRGADIDYIIKMTFSKYTPLVLASREGQIEVVKYLVENDANIHFNHDLALRLASFNGQTEVVKCLVENDANIHAQDDEALRYASSYGHIEVVKYLVENDANIHDGTLRIAQSCGHIEVVKYLKSLL